MSVYATIARFEAENISFQQKAIFSQIGKRTNKMDTAVHVMDGRILMIVSSVSWSTLRNSVSEKRVYL